MVSPGSDFYHSIRHNTRSSALLHSSSRSSIRLAQKRLGQWVMRPRSLWRAWISSVL